VTANDGLDRTKSEGSGADLTLDRRRGAGKEASR
jgi:hypothetical protein